MRRPLRRRLKRRECGDPARADSRSELIRRKDTKGHATLVWNNLRHVVDRNDQKRCAPFAGEDDKIKGATLTAKLLDQPEQALRRLDPESAHSDRQATARSCFDWPFLR